MSLILLVDDEAPIRTLVRNVLERDGHEVLEAESGPRALEIAENTRPDLLITDIVMPEMTGLVLAARMHRLRPRCPVLFISGFASEFEEELTGAVCLDKPFTPAQLLASVTDALGSASVLRHASPDSAA